MTGVWTDTDFENFAKVGGGGGPAIDTSIFLRKNFGTATGLSVNGTFYINEKAEIKQPENFKWPIAEGQTKTLKNIYEDIGQIQAADKDELERTMDTKDNAIKTNLTTSINANKAQIDTLTTDLNENKTKTTTVETNLNNHLTDYNTFKSNTNTSLISEARARETLKTELQNLIATTESQIPTITETMWKFLNGLIYVEQEKVKDDKTKEIIQKIYLPKLITYIDTLWFFQKPNSKNYMSSHQIINRIQHFHDDGNSTANFQLQYYPKGTPSKDITDGKAQLYGVRSNEICLKYIDLKEVEKKELKLGSETTASTKLEFPVESYFPNGIWYGDGSNNPANARNVRSTMNSLARSITNLKTVVDQLNPEDINNMKTVLNNLKSSLNGIDQEVLEKLNHFTIETLDWEEKDEDGDVAATKQTTLTCNDLVYFPKGWAIRYKRADNKYIVLTSSAFTAIHQWANKQIVDNYYTQKVVDTAQIGKNKKKGTTFRSVQPQTDPEVFDEIDLDKMNAEREAEHQIIDRIFDYINLTYNALNETDQDLENNHLTNKQLGLIFRNSIFAESMKNSIPLKPLKPQELAAYGFVNFEQHGSEIFDDHGRHAFKTCTYSIDSNSNTILNIELKGIDHYHADHLIIHVFERERDITKLGYALSNIDLVFDVQISSNQIESNLSSKLYTYSITKDANVDKVMIQIIGTFNLKMLEDENDLNFWEDQEENIEPDIELDNRIIVYYQLPANENFKNYLATLGSSSGSIDFDTLTRITNLENTMKNYTERVSTLESNVDQIGNVFSADTTESEAYRKKEGFVINNQAKTLALNEEKPVVLTFEEKLKKWQDEELDQLKWLNQGIKEIWSFCAGLSEDLSRLEENQCQCGGSGTVSDDKLTALERKCKNIETDLTFENLTTENRIKILEDKTKNIECDKFYDSRIQLLEEKCSTIE